MSRNHFKDNENYWLERHREFKNDIRSVGNMGKDIQTNIQGYEEKNSMLKTAILQTFDSVEGKDVLEVGCGVGMMAGGIVELGATYTGIDISEEALDQARERCPTGTFLCHSIVDFHLDSRFDLVFCTDVLVHLINDDNWHAAIRNMKGHLKPGGLVIIKEIAETERKNPAPHVVHRSIQEYQDVCHTIGFQLCELFPGGPFYKLTPKIDS